MSEPTNTEVIVVPAEDVPQKTPFYKNRRILKTAGIVAASAAAGALIVRKFTSKDSDEASNENNDTVEFTVTD